MQLQSGESQGQYGGIFLFVAGMGLGGFLAAILFAMAVGGGLVQLV